MEFNTKLKTTFRTREEAEMAKAIAAKALIENDIFNGYADHPEARMAEDLKVEKNQLVLNGDNGYFNPEDIGTELNAFWEIIARAMPEVTFTAEANTDGTYSELISSAEYDGHNLKLRHILDEYDETGYVCPNCGFIVAGLNVIIDGNEVVCDDCGEKVLLSECEIIGCDTTETIINIR